MQVSSRNIRRNNYEKQLVMFLKSHENILPCLQQLTNIASNLEPLFAVEKRRTSDLMLSGNGQVVLKQQKRIPFATEWVKNELARIDDGQTHLLCQL